MKKISIGFFYCTTLFVAYITSNAQTIPGLDNTYNESGIFIDSSQIYSTFNDHVVLPDGSIVQLNTVIYQSGPDQGGFDTHFVKINPDGSINTAFKTLDPGNILLMYELQYSSMTKLLLQPDGKILAGGGTVGDEIATDGTLYKDEDIAVARLLPNGNPDPSFGTNGRLIIDLGSSMERVTDIALTSTGNIVLTGIRTTYGVFIIRLLPNGAYDTSFDGDGIWHSPPLSSIDKPEIELDNAGNIILAINHMFHDVFLYRLFPDGTIDNTFGTNGSNTINIFSPEYSDRSLMNDMILDSGNNIYLATWIGNGNIFPDSAAIFKISENGFLDNSFGNHGHFAPSDGSFGAMDFTTDNKIVAVGKTEAGLPLVCIMTTNGQLDTSPDYNNGLISGSVADGNTPAYLRAVTYLPDGKIIASGTYTKQNTSRSKILSLRLAKIPPKPDNCPYQSKIVGRYFSLSGLCKDQQGNIFATDESNDRVIKYNSDGIIIQTWAGSTHNNNQLFGNPTAIVCDKNNNVYVLDGQYNTIHKFTNDGTTISTWGTFGSGNGQLNSPSDICIDNTGNYLYVADNGNGRVQKIDLNGNYISQWVTDAYSICADANGFVYVARNSGNKIDQFTSDGTWTMSIQLGTYFCSDMDINPTDQSLYVAGNNVVVYNASGTFVKSISNVTNCTLSNIVLKADGSFGTACFGINGIEFYDAGGSHTTNWRSTPPADGRFNNASAFTGDIAGNIYIADELFQIQKLSAQGAFITKWGTQGSDDSQFNNISDIFITKNNRVYVVDSGNNNIQYFDTDGNFIRKWGTKGSENGQFFQPTKITVDLNNDVYVWDAGNCRIQKFTSDGNFLLTWSICELGIEDIQYPSNNLMTDSQGNIYLALSYRGKIAKFNSSGTFISDFSLIDYSGNKNISYEICLVGDHFYTVFPGNNNLVKFSLDGTFISSCNYMPTQYVDNFRYIYRMSVSVNGTAYLYDNSDAYIASIQLNSTPVTTSTHQSTSTTDEQSNCLVFPNPSTGVFTINTSEDIDHVVVYDVNGISEVHTTSQIDTHLKGLLLVKVFLKNGGMQQSKVIKL